MPPVDRSCPCADSAPAMPAALARPVRSTDATASDAEACRYIIDLVYERCRIRLHGGKEALIRARIGKLMRQQGVATLGDYVERLQTRGDAAEFTRLVDALTTNFTHFLREPDHFDILVEDALPKLLGPRPGAFRVWSAASSSGEEPYTMAMYLAEHFPAARGWNWQILATDLSTKVLAEARRAIYPAERARAIPHDWLRRYFQRGTGEWEEHVRVKPELAQRVLFQQLNLIEDYVHPQPFPAVFCRNVMIYFDRETQEQVVQRLCRFLLPGGYLFVGHSESLNGLDVPLECLKPSVYQRR